MNRRLLVFAAVGVMTLALLAWNSASEAASCSDVPAWSSFSPGSSPTGRLNPAAAWDSVNSRMVVFGGYSGGALSDVWSFSPAGNTWTQLFPTGSGPAATYQHAALYDPVRQRMVVFGGSTYSSAVYALSLDASPAWSVLSTTGSAPSNTGHVVAVYDTHRDRMIVVQANGDTYALAFNTNAWTYLGYGGCAVFGGQAGIYDPINQRVIIYGGYDYATPIGSCVVATFNYLCALPLNPPGNWQLLSQNGPQLTDPVAVFDPQCGRLIIYGGSQQMSCSSTCDWTYNYDQIVSSDVWSVPLTGSPTFTQLAPTGSVPAARSHHVGVYDPALNRLITFGGGLARSTCTYFNDVASLRLWDVTSPGATTSFMAPPSCEEIHLSWVSSGDDANRLHAATYEIYRSTTALNASNYAMGTLVDSGTPGPAGQTEQYVDPVGACSPRYYYAAVTKDEQGNYGTPAIVTFGVKTPCPPPMCFDELVTAGDDATSTTFVTRRLADAPGSVVFEMEIPRAMSGLPLDILLYDISGRQVGAIASGMASAGKHSVVWNAREGSQTGILRAGIYYARLRVGDVRLTKSVLVLP